MDAPAVTAGAQLSLGGQLLGARRHEGLQLPFGQQLLDQGRIQQVLQAVLQVHSRRVCNMHAKQHKPRSDASNKVGKSGLPSNIKVLALQADRGRPFRSAKKEMP